MDENLYFENKIKDVLDIYSNIELELLKLIIEKLKVSNGEIGGSLQWYVKRLKELGGLNKETLKIISKYTGLTKKEIKNMLETIGIDTIDALDLQNAYRKGEITIDPKTFYEDRTINKLIKKSYKTTTKTFLDINKKIEQSVNKKYVEILNTAYLETSTGVYDYGTSIRNALDKFANVGITAVTYRYEDGTKRDYNIEGVVRRDILSATHQLSGNIIEDIVEETEPEYIYLSEHLMARPTHEPWQGCYVRTEDFEAVTDYGDPGGIYGPNCKHFHYPYFGEVDETQFKIYNGRKLYTQDKKISSRTNRRLYELSQKQRAMERHVRQWKRRQITDEDKTLADKKVDFWQHKLRNFMKDHKELRRDYLREKISTKKKRVKI